MKRSKKILSEEECSLLIGHLATHPKSGDLIQGTGGIRKLRWKRKGSGKSGGVRIIYYFHNEKIPLFLLSIFEKMKNQTSLIKNAMNLLN